MRIIQFINALTWGGAQTLLLDLCTHLQRQGHEVITTAFRDGPIGVKLRSAGVRVEILPERFFDVVGFFRLRRLLSEFKPQVLHTHLFRATFWGRLAAGSLPDTRIITSVHGTESEGFHQVERRMAHKSQAFIFPSHALCEWYRREIRPLGIRRVHVLSPGTTIFPLKDRLSTRLNPVIGTLSRLHPVKGLDTFLEALALLRRQGQAFSVRIGGDGRERASLEALSKRLGLESQVTFCGSIETPTAFLETLDLFVSPSHEEAFGINVCEAMERGLPVIASDVGGLREIVQSTGGTLVSAGQPQALAEALRDLLDHPVQRLSLGKQAREQIVRNFDRQVFLRAHEALYLSFSPPPARKVIVAVSSRELGGGERLALALGRSLHDRGWKVQSLCGGNPLASIFQKNDIHTRSVSLRAGGLFFAPRLLAMAKQSPRAVIHAHLNRAALFAGWLDAALGIPAVAHVHGMNRASYYRNCRRLLAVSGAVSRHLQDQGIAKNRLVLAPNAIPPQPGLHSAPPAPPWIIGIVAKLHTNKGHAWALEAIEQQISQLPDFRLWIFGNGPERTSLEERFLKGPLAGRLTFWGFCPDMERFYPRLHAVLLPSLSEGIPLSLLEAMNYALPSIATNIGGIPEVITDGKNGLLIPPHDSAALIHALQELCQPVAWEAFSREARWAFQRKNHYAQLVDSVEKTLLDSLAGTHV